MTDKKKGSNIQITVAVIGLIGVLGAAIIANWDELFLPKPANGVSTPSIGLKTVYEDKEPNLSEDKIIKFIELKVSSIHNPPKLNDQISVYFTIQNVSDKPISVLGTYVTAYDPDGKKRDFAFGNKNTTIKPQEIVTTTGNLIVDVPGCWDLGPHYAVGEEWDGARYPGHWSRFILLVVQ